MKHYIVTREGRLWLTFAHNPKEAIFNVIGQGVDGDWHDFNARSVGSYTSESKTIEFKVVDDE